MKKTLLTVLSLILSAVLLVMPLVASASTAVEKDFNPVSTMWYSVEYTRTDSDNPEDDAYVYTWTPEADGELTIAGDNEYKDTLISVKNNTDDSDAGIIYRYYPADGYTSTESVAYNVKAGNEYSISIMTYTGNSGTVAFFAYYTQTTDSGLEGAGTYSNPYVVDNNVKKLPAIASGETVYFLYACDKTQKYDVKVNGSGANDAFDLYVENNKLTVASSNGSASVNTVTPFAATGYIMFAITNNSPATSKGYTYSVVLAADAGSKGTYEDPATLTLDTLTTADITSVCYYYTYTATEDGILSVNISTDNNWVCAISGGAAESAYCTASDEPVVNPIEYPVVAGEVISLWVATEDFGAGTVSFTASIVNEQETTAPLETDPVEDTTTETTVPTTTDTTEETTITTVETDPIEETTATETVVTKPAETDPIENTTDSTEPAVTTPAETDPTESAPATEETTSVTVPAPDVPEVTATESVPAVDEEGLFVDIYDEYCLSVNPVQLGDNQIVTSKVYPVTLFEFTPSEIGEYTITASDNNALVGGYVGTINYIPESAKGVTNQVVIPFAYGSDIIIAVSNTTECTLSIVKTGDVVIEEDKVQWIIYDNKVEVTPYDTSISFSELTAVFTYDEIANKAVLGNDGFYHLNTAQGEVIYVDLNSNIMSLVDIVANSKLSAVFYDEDGNVTEKIDFTSAVLEYIDNAAQIVEGEETHYLYPLTADLIEMYKIVGQASDWYGRTGWVGGIAEDAWMFACHYKEGAFTGNTDVPSNPSTIPTGRNFVVAQVAFVMIIAAAGVVLLNRKRIFG